MALRTPETQDEQDTIHDPSQQYYDEEFNRITAGLRNQENQAGHDSIPNYDRSKDGLDDHPVTAGNTSEKSNQNIDKAKSGEEAGSSINYTGGEKDTKKRRGKKVGPAATIGLLIGGGGLIGTLLLSPTLLLEHIKEVVVGKIDSMSSIIEQRSELEMHSRIFSTNATCAIKINCKYKGLTKGQLKTIRDEGGDVVDSNGKPLEKKNPITGRYTGGQKLILPSGEAVDASQFKKALRDPALTELRSLTRTVFPPLWISLKDGVASRVRSFFRLTSNPDFGKEGDTKDANKQVMAATEGENINATAESNTQYEKNPDGTDKIVNGNKVPIATDPGASNLDFSGDAQDINDQVQQLKDDVAAGKDLPTLPSDTASAAAMPEFVGKYSAAKGLKSVLGFLNPLDLFSGMCSVYQIIGTLLLVVETTLDANAMRFAAYMLAGLDKNKAGAGTADEAEKLANTYQKVDKYGDAFGESFSYNFVEYNKITDKPLTVSKGGNDVVRTLATVNHTVDSSLGGKKSVRTGCNILTNPFVQGGLALTSFIPGGGQLANILKTVVSKGGMAAARVAISEKIAAFVAKNLTKDALKDAARSAGTGLLDIAKSPGFAIFLGGYLLDRYGIPYLAQTIAGTEFVGADGVTAMDGTTSGYDALNSTTAQASGLTPLTKDEYTAFNQYNQSSYTTYLADMRAKSNPLDFNNPYSQGSQFAAAFYPLMSHFDVSHFSFAQITSIPSAILASFTTNTPLNNTALADAQDTQAELAYCKNDYLQSHNLATSPFCHVKYGFNDVNMLETVTPDAVNHWLLSKNQINNEGDPVPGSDFDKFKATCATGTEGKHIGDDGDESQQIDPMCYGDKNKTIDFKMYRLKLFDDRISSFSGDETN